MTELGVELVSVCDGLDTIRPTSRAIFKMIDVITELERKMIIEHTLSSYFKLIEEHDIIILSLKKSIKPGDPDPSD